MIRSVFWMSLGAAVGVSGYRKFTRLARAVSPGRAPESVRSWGAGSAQSGPSGPTVPPVPAETARAPWPARLARGAVATAEFARDVQDGMRLYRLSGRREAPTLGRHHAAGDWAATQVFADGECPDEVKDGR
jgi:hypothetical protein